MPGAIQAPAVTVELTRLELWRGGVLCMTGEPTPSLADLQQALRRGAAAAGLAVGERDFRPHVTLARLVQRLRSGESDPALPRPGWQVRSFCLMESHPRPDGGRYRSIARWDLQLADFDAWRGL
ncbi:MAG: 2'-5' RNA ligase family protein [Gammaproteobacteria bacterium]|nr:2'-5' RNA ligase family protein [Gammaproteobacteria bacterium]